MPEARQNSSKLPEMFESASSFSALVGTTVDVVSLFMALLSFVESAPRAYRLKASNAASPNSTSIGTIPRSFLRHFPPAITVDCHRAPSNSQKVQRRIVGDFGAC
jgi:hypothetical protein